MREIKFRVWDIDDCAYSGNWYALNCLQAMDRDVDYTRAKDRKIVEQYTGLKDKNGKEIYEGDIVTEGYGHQMMIQYELESASFRAVSDSVNTYMDDRLEIIGNIHEESSNA